MIEENLMSLSYDGFKTRLTTEVPHLEKMGSFLRLIILEDNEEVDLLSSFVYNITSSVWRNGLSVLKTTAFLVYPPHFSKFNCNPAPLNLETVNFQQSNVLCEASCFTVKRSPAVKYEMVL